MYKVLFAQNIDNKFIELLGENINSVVIPEGETERFRAEIIDSDAVITGTWIKIDKAIMDSAPKLKVISRTGVGVDNVDISCASQKGILVLNTQGANTISVAEHTVTMVCALAKAMLYLDKGVRTGNFSFRRLNLPCDLEGKTLGIVGCGNIGLLAAEKCKTAFNMEIIGYDPFAKQLPNWIKPIDNLEDLFSKADFISLHLPLTSDTKHIVNKKLLGAMKETAFIINTSRGGIVDENELYNVLAQKKIAGAALDVFESEPPPENWKLFELDNIILTPHSAALTKECSERVKICAIKGVADYFSGKTPKFIYNKEMLGNTL